MTRHSEGRHAKYVPPPVAALALASVLVGTASWVLLVVTYQRGGGLPERPVSQILAKWLLLLAGPVAGVGATLTVSRGVRSTGIRMVVVGTGLLAGIVVGTVVLIVAIQIWSRW